MFKEAITAGVISYVLILVACAASAQFIVTGQVFDAQTKSPLPGANVFLANTTKGVSSNVDGTFTIKGLPPHRYKLVVSFIGYETQVFDILPGQPVFFKVMLEPASNQLSEVVIRARKSSRSEWLANFTLFKKYFIGKSENWRMCTFENPRVIKFDNHQGILNAISDSSVVIENRGLGYKLKFLIQEYTLNVILIHIRYQGQVVYEPLVPENDEEKIMWARNRLKAYYGSDMHFLRALYKRNLFDEGFFIDLVNPINGNRMAKETAYDEMLVRSDVRNNKIVKVETIKNYKLVIDSVRSTPEEPVLNFEGELRIQYIHEQEEYDYQVERYGKARVKANQFQNSRMTLLIPGPIIQPVGDVFPPDAIETAGYWSWELVAESLPLDYDPEVDKQILGITRRPGEVRK